MGHLSQALQLGPQKGVEAHDLDAELERLYGDQVAPQRSGTRVGAPGSRSQMRAQEFTFSGDRMRIDYAYHKNGTHGFVQTLSVSRAPGDIKSLAYTVERIRSRVKASEFTAVTDVHLIAENERHKFVQETLREAGVASVPVEGFAVWVAKLKPLI